jgi:3-hydroxybutyryl-CoA dehydrogenase
MLPKKVAVLGAGQMGNGIVQVLALNGFSSLMYDINQAYCDKGLDTIKKSCDRLIKKESLSEDQKSKALALIQTTSKLEDLKGCDFVIEAIPENLDLKLDTFKKVSEIVGPNAILCSNTSSISITKIASVTQRPDKFAGMHFMNPVPLMKLVEGIKGLQTSNETFSAVRELAEKLQKTFVVSEDRPGFIVNRVLMPMINEAVYTLMEGIGKVEDIDNAMKLGTNQPMGPLQLADFIGLDTCLAIMRVLHDGLGDSKYRPCPLLVKYVEAGWMGKKSGRGFYTYETK